MQNVILFGSGGFAKEIIGYLEWDLKGWGDEPYKPRFNVIGCVSTEPFNNPEYAKRFPVWSTYPQDLLVGMGDVKGILAVAEPWIKRKLVAENPKVDWLTYVHPSAHVSPFARLGRGCVLTPQAMVCGDAMLGDFVTMNTNATVGHDARIGPWASMMPNTEVCGGCNIGADVFLGIGAYVLPGVNIGHESKASAGAIVRHDVPEAVTVYGDPAKAREAK